MFNQHSRVNIFQASILFFMHSNEINSLNFSLQSAGYNASSPFFLFHAF